MTSKKHETKDKPSPVAPPAPEPPVVEDDLPEVQVEPDPEPVESAIGTPSPTKFPWSSITIAEIAARLGADKPNGWSDPAHYRKLVARAILILTEAKEQDQTINPEKYKDAQ